MINIVDIVILAAFIGYVIIGYNQGFIKVLVEVIGFVFALAVSFAFYPALSSFFSASFSYPPSLANLGAFFVIWMIVDAVYLIGAHFLYNRVSRLITESTANRAGGAAASLVKAFIIISVTLTLIVSLPVSGTVKSTVLSSRLAPAIIQKTSSFEGAIQDHLGRALKDSLTYIAVKPKTNERVDLGYKVTNGKINESAELEMLKLLNQERVKVGLKPLIADEALRDVGRQHSRDMFMRGYFAHETPEGLSPFDRMDAAGIAYDFAGENLALAPSTDLAHTGLMNSPGHKANILDPNFRKIGIGCIDGGSYGKMYSQEFTD